MATVHKTPASPNWLSYYTDRSGERRMNSTLTVMSRPNHAVVSHVLTRDSISHESGALSRNYTRIEAETKRAALDKPPDVT